MICDKSFPVFWHSFPTGTMVHMLGIVAIAPNNPHHVHGHEGTTGWETFVTFSWLDNCGMQLGVPHLHCLYDFLSDWLCVCLTDCLSYFFTTFCLSDILFIWFSVCLTFCLPEFMSVCLSDKVWPTVWLPGCLPVWLAGWMGIKLPGCLSVILLMFWTTFVLITK